MLFVVSARTTKIDKFRFFPVGYQIKATKVDVAVLEVGGRYSVNQSSCCGLKKVLRILRLVLREAKRVPTCCS
jgi:hypothetical protein